MNMIHHHQHHHQQQIVVVLALIILVITVILILIVVLVGFAMELVNVKLVHVNRLDGNALILQFVVMEVHVIIIKFVNNTKNQTDKYQYKIYK